MNWYEILYSFIADGEDDKLLSIANETGVSFDGDWFCTPFFSGQKNKLQATLKMRIYPDFIQCFLLDKNGEAKASRIIKPNGDNSYDKYIKTALLRVRELFGEARRKNGFVAYLDSENAKMLKGRIELGEKA